MPANQSRILPSLAATAMARLSGENATELISLGTLSVQSSCFVVTSQSFTLLSGLPLMILFPSGEKASEITL